jgi:ABC-type Mn2+/Zn2+ transport system permease subunit
MYDAIGIILALFFWLVAPPVIARDKGRRWWVWLIIAVIFPFGSLIWILMIHSAKKDGSTTIS